MSMLGATPDAITTGCEDKNTATFSRDIAEFLASSRNLP